MIPGKLYHFQYVLTRLRPERDHSSRTNELTILAYMSRHARSHTAVALLVPLVGGGATASMHATSPSTHVPSPRARLEPTDVTGAASTAGAAAGAGAGSAGRAVALHSPRCQRRRSRRSCSPG